MKSLHEYCTERHDDLLLRQWHSTKNGDLRPESVVEGSHKKAWWICDKGHEWQARISTRVKEQTGCPVCTNRRLSPGENDLNTLFPHLAKEWNTAKNGNLAPEQVMPWSRRKVWWVCKKGHEWEASLTARTRNGTGCPYCARRHVIPGENDLSSCYPEIASQWHPAKNGTLKPESLLSSSNQKVWWICEKGHEWQATIFARTRDSSGCPYCTGRKVLAGFNDLATVEPELAAQWHPELNEALTPEQVTKGCSKKVWWRCSDGHAWKALVSSRTAKRRTGCPVCAGKVREDRYRDMMAEIKRESRKI